MTVPKKKLYPCRECGRPVLWIKTKRRGRSVPLDPEEYLLKPEKNGPDRVYDEQGNCTVGVFVSYHGTDVVSGRRVHWTSCPESEKYKRTKK